jgi:DNA-directed RNA polymerase specialized sigma24 family protein
MANPAGYLYRIGQSRTRRRRFGFTEPHASSPMPCVEPALDGALRELTEQRRACVVLVHGFGWTATEDAELLGVKTTTATAAVKTTP